MTAPRSYMICGRKFERYEIDLSSAFTLASYVIGSLELYGDEPEIIAGALRARLDDWDDSCGDRWRPYEDAVRKLVEEALALYDGLLDRRKDKR